MSDFIGKGLDNWITGHYGADQDQGDEPEPDEGEITLTHAITYLEDLAVELNEIGQTDDDLAEAGDLLYDFRLLIRHEYMCAYCGRNRAPKKGGFCSRNCATSEVSQ
jgi:hypothetical protein